MTEEVIRGLFPSSPEQRAEKARELLQTVLDSKGPLPWSSCYLLLSFLLLNEISEEWQRRTMARLLKERKENEEKLIEESHPAMYRELLSLVEDELRRLDDEETKRVKFYHSQPSGRSFRDGTKRPRS